MNSDIDQYVASSQAEFEEKLREWVEIPTISAAPENKNDIQRGADAAVQYLRALGADAEVVPTPGNPVVIGKFMTGADRPTVTIYNHLDVQPANEPQWRRAPFVFHKDGNRYIGRGSTDDKGPALTALFGARYALEKGTAVNIQFIWEFEEEIGSPNFEHFLETESSGPCDRLDRGIRHHLDRSGKAGHCVWLAWARARETRPRDRHERRAFRFDRRRGAESDFGTVPAYCRMLRRAKGSGSHSRLLR